MKKSLLITIVLVLVSAVCLSACAGGNGSLPGDQGQTEEAASPAATSSSGIASLDDGVVRICLLINGNLGDMSFFDSANEGLLQFAADYPDVDVKIVEMGTDNTKWEPTLRQTANEAYDLIIVGTTDMREPLQRLVKNSKYADRRFVIFDTEIEDNNAAAYETVHSILFKQNEGGFLAGALASVLSSNSGSDRTGFIGGMKIDIINDFGYGFMQGVARANEDYALSTLAYNSYIGDFFNSPKGKSLADTMYGEGVEILFAAASQAGLGCLDSAKNNDKLVIGVDSDQYFYFKDTDPDKADRIVTSVLKRVDLALYEACEQFLTGDLDFATLSYLGVAEGKIGLADNEHYRAMVDEETRAYIDSLTERIVSGEIVVSSGLKRFTTTEELNEKLDSLDPNKR